MISPQLKNNLQDIQQNLLKYDNISRVDLYSAFISEKLDASLHNYNNDISLSTHFLEKQSSVRVTKAIAKLEKAKDKEIIKQNLIQEGTSLSDDQYN